MTNAHILTLSQSFEDLDALSNLYIIILGGEITILLVGCLEELVELLKKCWSTYSSERPSFVTICDDLNEIISNDMHIEFFIIENSLNALRGVTIEKCDIKEEQGQVKEEGHTSFFRAQDISLCSEVVSRESDSKVDVSKQPIIKLEL